MRTIFLIFFLVTALFSTAVYAQPLSDLNLEAVGMGDLNTTEESKSGPEGDLMNPWTGQSVNRAPASDLAAEDLLLYGIVVGEEEAYALVSGNMLRVGERIAGYRVRQIGTDNVILQKLDKRVVLRLQGGI